jgi:TetR/AcrR family transcriptional regulator, mexCD-oprJ operon repressor
MQSQPVPAYPPQPGRRRNLQQRVADAILDGAARVFVERGGRASMSEVAEAAGVARATVYRYFPSRETLLEELGRVALENAVERLASARIDEVPVDEAVARAVRALVDVGDSFVVLARERLAGDTARPDQKLSAPLGRLLERGQAEGGIRGDISSRRLADALVGLVVSIAATGSLGREDATSMVASLFLDGARPRRLAAR